MDHRTPPDLDPDSIAARLSDEMRARVNAAMNDRMNRESEMAAYDAEAVAELGRNVI